MEVPFQSLFFFQKWFLEHTEVGRVVYRGRRQRVQSSRLLQSMLTLYEDPGGALLNGGGTAKRNIYKNKLVDQIKIIWGQILKLILKWISGSVWQNDVNQFLRVWDKVLKVWSSLRSIGNTRGFEVVGGDCLHRCFGTDSYSAQKSCLRYK